MTLSEDELVEVLLGELNESEREGAVIYLTVEPVSAGEVVNVPGLEIHIPWDAALASRGRAAAQGDRRRDFRPPLAAVGPLPTECGG